MSEQKHTNWKATPNYNGTGYFIEDRASGKRIAYVVESDSCFTHEECKQHADLLTRAANTHYQLVAALEAVKRDIVPEFLEDHPGSYRALHLMDDALKAVKGET